MVCKIFFAPISPIFQKSCGEEEDDKNRQIQSVLLFNQTQKEKKESGDTSESSKYSMSFYSNAIFKIYVQANQI